YREYSVNSSGVWTDGGEKLAGIEDYRMAAYHSAEGRIDYAFLDFGPNYMMIKSHTYASTSVTSIYNSADPSAVSGTAYYAAGDAAVYMTFDEGIGYMLYSLASNAKTTIGDNLMAQKNQMVYANSRLYFLAIASGDYDVLQVGIGLYQWSDQLVLNVPLEDFSGSFVTDMFRKVLNAFLFMGVVSHVKKALVYRRGDITGAPLTSGHDLSITVS